MISCTSEALVKRFSCRCKRCFGWLKESGADGVASYACIHMLSASQWTFFWGAAPLSPVHRLVIAAPSAVDLLKLLTQGAVFAYHTTPATAFSISETFAWQQRLAADDQKISYRRNADCVSGIAWSLFFVVRRPWGIALALVLFGLSFAGLARFPLPESAAQRLSLRAMAGHYLFAALIFASFGFALVGAHGVNGWPVLPFAALLTLTGTLALCGHTTAVERLGVAAHMHTAGAMLEWACAILFHLALMLPPERPPEHQWRLLASKVAVV